jgi:hypothetical protein
VIALSGVVVHHVHDDFDVGAMQCLDHSLELTEMVADGLGGRVRRIRSEVTDRAVTPVVRQSALDEVLLVGDVMHGKQLDRGDPERAEVLDRRIRGKACVGSAKVLTHVGMALGEALDVCLIDHRVRPGPIRPSVALPVEGLVDDDALRDGDRVVAVVDLQIRAIPVTEVGEHRRFVVANPTVNGLRVRVDQQLAGIEPEPGRRFVGPIDPVGVTLTRTGTG